MSVIVLSGTGAVQADGRIGFHNLFTESTATVTASGETADYEKENAYDWKQYDWWKHDITGTSWLRASFPGAVAADYLCVFGHNLHEVGGSVKPQYSTDGGANWVDAAAFIAPDSGRTLFVGFDSVLGADWRCLIVTTTGPAVIAGIMIGRAMVFERDVQSGFEPPTLSPNIETKTAMSEMGVNLGSSNISTGLSGTITLANVTSGWVRDEWKPLIDHLNRGYPCAFAWDYISHPEESCLIWKTRDIGKPSNTSRKYMTVDFQYEGIL